MKLIDKDALVAEIERQKKSCEKDGPYWCGRVNSYNDIISMFDTLEVKEVDANDAFIKKACDAYCKACNKPSYSVPIPFCRRRCESYNNFIKNINL